MNKKILTYAGLFFSMIVWALSYVFIKITYDYGIKPATLVFARLICASAFFILYGLLNKKIEKIRKGDFKWFVLMTLFEPVLYYLGESNGLQYVSASVGAIIIATVPVFTPIMMHLFCKEKIPKNIITGIILSFTGILLVIFNDDANLQASGIGLLLMTFTVICALGFTISLRKLVSKYNSTTVVAYQTFIGSVLYLPLWLICDFNSIDQISFSLEIILIIAGLAIFASCIAYIFFSNGIRELGATKTTIFSNLIPVFTAFFAFFISNESMPIGKILGIIIVIIGVTYSQNTKMFSKLFSKAPKGQEKLEN